ncbi:hypothetical protein FCV25MIE_07983, partial [Fagus crenata]
MPPHQLRWHCTTNHYIKPPPVAHLTVEAREGKRNNYNLKLQNLEKITHFAGVIGGVVPSWLVWWRCQ